MLRMLDAIPGARRRRCTWHKRSCELSRMPPENEYVPYLWIIGLVDINSLGNRFQDLRGEVYGCRDLCT
jgi:hypothetical protein